MNVKILNKIKHNGTVYEAGSTIFNMSDKDAIRLIELNIAEVVKDTFLNKFIDDEDPEGEGENSETDSEKDTDENPKQGKKKKSDKKSDEE